jgi:hypothetical protein
MSIPNVKPIRVFLCHATADKLSVRKLYKKLNNDSIQVWFDEENLLPGQDWDSEIQNAVRQSDVVIICLSSKSVTKEGYVQKEIKIALDVADQKPEDTIFIVPVRLEECNVPQRLRRWQWIDIFSPVSAIDEANYKKLIRSVELRAEQIQVRLHSSEDHIEHFEPSELTFGPYRAWISPNPKTVLNNIKVPEPDANEIDRLINLIENSLWALNLPSQVVGYSVGSRVTRFGIKPLYKQVDDSVIRVSVSDILSNANDLAMLMRLNDIQIVTVPGESYIGIDIPYGHGYNINLLNILESQSFQTSLKPLTIALGEDVEGNPVFTDLSSYPNILLSGTANAGKSMCLTSIVLSLVLNNNPNELRLLFIDLRRVEFSAFFDMPHLLSSVIINKTVAISAFDWLLKESDDRKRLFAKSNVRNIDEYNRQAELNEKLPYIIVFISELSDLMIEFPNKIQAAIIKLTGLARLIGIHLVVATQQTASEIITETIKTNFSNRIALKTLSEVDSVNMIGFAGAEKLLGRGDMLFLCSGKSKITRLQGVSISDDEIIRLVEFWKSQIA